MYPSLHSLQSLHSAVLLDVCSAPDTALGVTATAVREDPGPCPREIYVLVWK